MYKCFDWLMYVVEKDVALCYLAEDLLFQIPQKQDFFVPIIIGSQKYGFNKWKKALDKGQGMYKHPASLYCIESVKL